MFNWRGRLEKAGSIEYFWNSQSAIFEGNKHANIYEKTNTYAAGNSEIYVNLLSILNDQ